MMDAKGACCGCGKKQKTAGGTAYADANGFSLVRRRKRQNLTQRHPADSGCEHHRLGPARQDARGGLAAGGDQSRHGSDPGRGLQRRRGRERQCPRRHQDRASFPGSVHRKLYPDHPQPEALRREGHLLQLHAGLRLDAQRSFPSGGRRLDRAVLSEGHDPGRPQGNGGLCHELHREVSHEFPGLGAGAHGKAGRAV